MNIGTAPIHDDLVDNEPSLIGSTWETFFSQLATQINTTFTNLGYFLPVISQSTADNTGSSSTQSIAYNGDNARAEINNSGEFEGISTVLVKTTSEIQNLISKNGNLGRIYINSDNNSLQFSVDGSTIRTIAST